MMPAFVRNHSSRTRLMMPAFVRNHSSRTRLMMPAFVRNHSSRTRLMMPAFVRNHSSSFRPMMPAFVRNHSSSPRLMMPALVRNHSSRFAEQGKQQVEMWDVPGSPFKPKQTGVTRKIKPIFKNSNKKLTFFMKMFEKISVGWKNALRINQHFNLAYIPSPRVNHNNSGTVANSIQVKDSYEMLHFLSLPKILPSFNIGVILALIQCFLIKSRGKRMCYSTENKVQSLKRGSTAVIYV